MGSGVSGRYSGTRGSNEAKNGVTYNTARSSSVKKVNIVTNSLSHSVPKTYKPNSVFRKTGENGLVSERYYNNKGEPYLDIDYTDHGNAEHHPIVPHQHGIKFINNSLNREKKGKKIK